MAQVTVNINGRNYDITCDDGQEDHLQTLAGQVDSHIAELASAVGQVGDRRLLLLACLMLADELAEARKSLSSHSQGQNKQAEDLRLQEGVVANRLESMAERIEGIAEQVKAS